MKTMLTEAQFKAAAKIIMEKLANGVITEKEAERDYEVLRKNRGEEVKKYASRDEMLADMEREALTAVTHVPTDKAAKNSVVSEMIAYMEGVKDRILREEGEYQALVLGIQFFTKETREGAVLRPDKYDRVGKMHVRLPRDYAEVRYYNRVRKETEWHEFGDYMLDQFRPSFLPHPGSGDLVLAIKQRADGSFFVRLPVKRFEAEGKVIWLDQIKTKDIRFGFPHRDNNANLEAGLNAFLGVFTNTFKRSNPKNRHGFDEHCGNCKYSRWVKRYDENDNFGEQEDYNNKFSDQGIITNSQFGRFTPQQICTVFGDYTDQEVIMELNETEEFESDYFYDERISQETGEPIGYRRLSPQEVVIGGTLRKLRDIRKEGTMDRCSECPFYHKWEAKSEEKFAQDKVKAKEAGENPDFVSRFYSERADASRMVIMTETDKGWERGFPGEFETPYQFKVFGLGGVHVYGTPEVMGAADPAFVAPVEEYDEVNGYAAKVANYAYTVAFRLMSMTEATRAEVEADLERIGELLADKPEGLSEAMDRRWDRAVSYLQQTILNEQ